MPTSPNTPTLADVLAVIARCRSDLDTPSAAALPELVERLARQRLADLSLHDHIQDEPGTVIGSDGEVAD